jgi:hypothetical protein
VRRDARRAERRGLARDGRITLRRALGIATAVVAGWLLLAGPLSLAPSGVRADPASQPADTPSATAATPQPTPTPCQFFFCNSPPPRETPTPTATPTPTPAPSPTPTAAPTAVPTTYSDSIDPQQTQASIPLTNANLGEVPLHTGGGSSFAEWMLFAIVVCAVVAGASFFFFFKIR